MAQATVRDGLRDLESGEEWEPGRVRRPGAGRPAVTVSDPEVKKDPHGLLEPVTVGDPERVSVRWTSKSAAKLAGELRIMGHVLVDRTVLRLPGQMSWGRSATRVMASAGSCRSPTGCVAHPRAGPCRSRCTKATSLTRARSPARCSGSRTASGSTGSCSSATAG
ncbi:MAG: ISAzo13-like element transposase-related protein [Solirubrobacteraceae bacterium]